MPIFVFVCSSKMVKKARQRLELSAIDVLIAEVHNHVVN